MAKGNRDQKQDDRNDNRKNAGHGDTMGRDTAGRERQHNDSTGRGSRDNSRREQGGAHETTR